MPHKLSVWQKKRRSQGKPQSPLRRVLPYQVPKHSTVVVVQSPGRVQLFATQRTAACQASLSLTISRSLPKFMFIASVIPYCHLILWHLLLLLPSVFLSIRGFSDELAAGIRWPKYWSFSISPSSEYSRLISLKVDWFDLLAVRGTLRSLLHRHSSEASILWPSLQSSSHNCMWPLGSL